MLDIPKHLTQFLGSGKAKLIQFLGNGKGSGKEKLIVDFIVVVDYGKDSRKAKLIVIQPEWA
jgi:hypothetical protein